MKKRNCALLLVMCLIIIMLVLPADAESIEGIYGDNIKWHLDTDTGTLTISGTGIATGLLPDSSSEGYAQYRLNIRHIVIADGFTEIAPYSFTHFSYLESIWIGDTVEIIGESAFTSNFKVTQLHLGKRVATIGVNAFATMEKLQELVLPDSVRDIGAEAFAISGITEVAFPEGVTVINGGSFRDNRNLKRIWIPTSVVEIKDLAFRDCESLTDVYYAGTEAQWNAISIEHTDEPHGDGKTGGNTYLLSATVHYNHTHSWDAGTVTVTPGCNQDGEKICTCTECGAVGTVKIEPQHAWDSGTTNADTTVTYKCTLCSAVKTEGTPATEPPATEPPATEPPVTEPPETEPPATEPPATEPPATEPPATEPPATEPPATEPPATEPPATEPPATEPPATEPPATEPPATEETLAQGGESTEGSDNTATGPEDGDKPADPGQETPQKFPWVAVCAVVAVLLAGGGTGMWFWLRKKKR